MMNPEKNWNCSLLVSKHAVKSHYTSFFEIDNKTLSHESSKETDYDAIATVQNLSQADAALMFDILQGKRKEFQYRLPNRPASPLQVRTKFLKFVDTLQLPEWGFFRKTPYTSANPLICYVQSYALALYDLNIDRNSLKPRVKIEIVNDDKETKTESGKFTAYIVRSAKTGRTKCGFCSQTMTEELLTFNSRDKYHPVIYTETVETRNICETIEKNVNYKPIQEEKFRVVVPSSITHLSPLQKKILKFLYALELPVWNQFQQTKPFNVFINQECAPEQALLKTLEGSVVQILTDAGKQKQSNIKKRKQPGEVLTFVSDTKKAKIDE